VSSIPLRMSIVFLLCIKLKTFFDAFDGLIYRLKQCPDTTIMFKKYTAFKAMNIEYIVSFSILENGS